MIKYEQTTQTYEQKYQNGYGIKYPDGHIIRIHKYVLDYELGIKEGKILDYGCGTGTHLQYFLENGFTPFGFDISKIAVDACKSKMPQYEKNFHVVPNIPNLKNYFVNDFDIILSNQVLYYLNDKDIENLISQFYDLLKVNGIFIATMMLPSAGYYKHIESTEGEMSKVVLKGRLNETTYINFKTKEQILQIFSKFTKLHLGNYGALILENEGASDHSIFIGIKK